MSDDRLDLLRERGHILKSRNRWQLIAIIGWLGLATAAVRYAFGWGC